MEFFYKFLKLALILKISKVDHRTIILEVSVLCSILKKLK